MVDRAGIFDAQTRGACRKLYRRAK